MTKNSLYHRQQENSKNIINYCNSNTFQKVKIAEGEKKEKGPVIIAQKESSNVVRILEGIHSISNGAGRRIKKKIFEGQENRNQAIINIFQKSIRNLMKKNIKADVMINNPNIKLITIGKITLNKDLIMKKFLNNSTSMKALRFYVNKKSLNEVKETKQMRKVQSAHNMIKNSKSYLEKDRKIAYRVKSEIKTRNLDMTDQIQTKESLVKSNDILFLTGSMNLKPKTSIEIFNPTPVKDDIGKNLLMKKSISHTYLMNRLKNYKPVNIVEKCIKENDDIQSLNKELKDYSLNRVSSDILKIHNHLKELHGVKDIEKLFSLSTLLGGNIDPKTGLPPQKEILFEYLNMYDKIFSISNKTVFKYREMILKLCGIDFSNDKNLLLKNYYKNSEKKRDNLIIEKNHSKISMMTNKINYEQDRMKKKIDNRIKKENNSVEKIFKESSKKPKNDFIIKYGKTKV